ncbi:hypothetical protein C922_05494 [Plasmodium inui San Antonio 1]|uniref:Uncharacterized protein n=1 Tax=Plasmodium inui San Antonio 1 TaxID=1237626 RepID=W6ZXU2_9APIC|nr:hypothetical protein C922_05494 [Plasmodium inui San Antonio 1]EUD64123.1 hypothetical protein C922_05494 [Plasmodium inui San Antonio 1]
MPDEYKTGKTTNIGEDGQTGGQRELILQIQPGKKMKTSLPGRIVLGGNSIPSLGLYIIKRLNTRPKQATNEGKEDLTIILIYIHQENEEPKIPGELG